MADVFSKKKRSAVMSRIRSSGNKDTEEVIARLFRKNRIKGWRRHIPLPGRPDFLFQRARLAVFIDGCFWHACPHHGTKPKSNIQYWRTKLDRNQARDRAVARLLKQKRWRVLRFWEHELKRPEKIVRKVEAALRKVPLAVRNDTGSNTDT